MTTDRAGPQGTIESVETRTLPSGAVLTIQRGKGWHCCILQGPYHLGDVYEMMAEKRRIARSTCGSPPETP